MTSARDFTERAVGIHSKIGGDLQELGGVLRCKQCGHEEAITKHDLGAYLRAGWPKHCGHTMTWVTARQLANGE